MDLKDINGKELTKSSFIKFDNQTCFIVFTKSGYSIFSEKHNKVFVLDDEIINEYNVELIEKIEIKSDEKLFNQFHFLANSIRSLSSIVQNDQQVEMELIEEWERIFDLTIKDLRTLKMDMKKHISN